MRMGRGDAERKRNKENLVGTAFLRVSEEYQLIEDNGSSSPWVKRVISFFFPSVWQFHVMSVAVFCLFIYLAFGPDSEGNYMPRGIWDPNSLWLSPGGRDGHVSRRAWLA